MPQETFVARIDPSAQTYQFKHPAIPMVIRKPLDFRDPTKGWVRVSPEQAALLRPIRMGGSSDRRAPPLFEIMTQEQALLFQQAEMEKLGLGTPENPLGGTPMQAAKIRELEVELSSMKGTAEKQTAILMALLAKLDPSMAEKLKGETAETLGLALAPATVMPASIHDVPEPPPVVKPAAPAGAAKVRPGTAAAAQPNAKRNTIPADPASLTSKLREEGKLGAAPTDFDDGTAGAESA